MTTTTSADCTRTSGRLARRSADDAGGADDYLAKPFGVRELMARVTAITRRHPGRAWSASAPALGALSSNFRWC
jgi:DNA-binding response OmpR family regulator